MSDFIDVILHDPILLAAGVILAVTVSILIWALAAWRNTRPRLDESIIDEETAHSRNPEVIEAHLNEITCQLTEIGRRLTELEKIADKIPSFDKTISTAASAADTEKLVQRIETKLEEFTANRPGDPPEGLSEIKAKLEGIHKLLIFLTDSGGNYK